MMSSLPREPNPYAPPETVSAPAKEATPDHPQATLAWVRSVFAVQLGAIVISGIIVLEDKGFFQSRFFSSSIGAPMGMAALYALPLCPVAMVVALSQLRRPFETKIGVVAVEVFLTLFHFWVTALVFTC